MLDELMVRNLGVLSEARLEAAPGLTIITGETGTGKTLLLGALRQLLGQSARSDLVGPLSDEAVVDGRFLRADGSEVVVGRKLTASGRSRAYLDGSMASASALDVATSGLVEIVGQHDQLLLTKTSEVRALIDRRLDGTGLALLDEYRGLWDERRRLLLDRDRLGGDRPALERERDLAEHQVAEISGAGFEEGDDIELAIRLARLLNAADLGRHLGSAADHVAVAREEVGVAIGEVRKAVGLDPSLSGLGEEVGQLEDRLGELAMSVGGVLESLDGDPGELEEAAQKSQTLNDLKRRYGVALSDVLEFGAQAEIRLAELADLLGRADRIESDLAKVDHELAAVGRRLGECRRAAALELADVATHHLRDLGFSDPVVQALVSDIEPSPSGTETVTLLFASDARLTPGEIGKVASGGELSRLILALKLAGGTTVETLVFDEIDSGVGGATALEVGRKLAALATDFQVLCVTHLPQVAAFADVHYVVERQGSEAGVRKVESEARLEELSRMLAGLTDSERGRQAAEELLEIASRTPGRGRRG